MLHLETALPHVGSTFEIRFENGQVVSLQLIEAKDLGSTPRQEQFQLLFKGPADAFLQQTTYCLTHAVLGDELMLLTPNARAQDGFLYHAVYNRLVK